MDSRGFWSDSKHGRSSRFGWIGEYQLLKRLGDGALGEAFLAEHRLMKRPCVVKILPTDLVNIPGFITRFESEIERLAQLDHPNLAHLHNIVEADGRFGLVFDAILDSSGRSTNLYHYIHQQGRVSEDGTYHILMQVAEALDAIHEHTLHGALKPNNILFRNTEEPLSIALTDTGLANFLGSRNPLLRTFRAVAETAGGEFAEDHRPYLQTWAFMAPEQRWAQPETEITQSVDAYSFGLLAYYLLFGELPEAVVEFPPRPTRLRWEELIRHCLQREPSLRPTSLKEAMRQLTGETIEDSPQPVIQSSQLTRPTVDLNPELALRVDSTVRVYQAEEKELSNILPIPTEMVVIPAGRYWRGSLDGQRDEVPRHQINLTSFAMDVHPVTNEQFVRFLTAMGRKRPLPSRPHSPQRIARQTQWRKTQHRIGLPQAPRRWSDLVWRLCLCQVGGQTPADRGRMGSRLQRCRTRATISHRRHHR